VQTLGHQRESLTHSQSACPGSSNSFEIAAYVVGHYLRQLVAVMPIKGGSESL
jgi:hypothetical protein